MISADNNGDGVTAKQIFEAIQEIQPQSALERIERLTVDAVFHTGFGQLTLAPALLRDLVAEALTLTQPAVRCAHIRRACFGIARYDDPTYARELLLTALSTFEDLRLWPQAVVCIEDLGTLAISRGDYGEAEGWIMRAKDMRSLGNDVFSASVEYELRVILAFERMDASDLPEFSLPVEVSEAFLRSARSRQTHVALRAGALIVADQLGGLQPMLGELAVLHDRMKTRGYQDFTTAVLATGLAELGRVEDAEGIVAAYFQNERRERVSPPPALTRIAERLGVVRSDYASALRS
jgi:hypothetical protein